MKWTRPNTHYSCNNDQVINAKMNPGVGHSIWCSPFNKTIKRLIFFNRTVTLKQYHLIQQSNILLCTYLTIHENRDESFSIAYKIFTTYLPYQNIYHTQTMKANILHWSLLMKHFDCLDIPYSRLKYKTGNSHGWKKKSLLTENLCGVRYKFKKLKLSQLA